MPSTKKKSKRSAATEADLESEITKLGFVHLPVPSDGNCFYHSILSHFRMARVPGLEDETIASLRRQNVDYMLDHIHDIIPFVIEKNSNIVNGEVNEERKLARVRNDIEKMRADGAWASEIGDMISMNIAKNLHIKLIIHDWKWAEGRFDTIVIDPADYGNVAPLGGAGGNHANAIRTTVHLLRINDGHYELLYSLDDFNGYAKAKWAEESARMAYEDAITTFEIYMNKKTMTRSSFESYMRILERRLDTIESNESELYAENVNNDMNTDNMRLVVSDFKQELQRLIENAPNSVIIKERAVPKTRKQKSPTRNELKVTAKRLGINVPKGTRKNVLKALIESAPPVSSSNNFSISSTITSNSSNISPPIRTKVVRPPTPPLRRSARIQNAKTTVSTRRRKPTNRNDPILKRAKNLNLIRKNATANSVNINALRNLLEGLNLANNGNNK